MSSQQSTQKIRLDKWLWAARFFKTRALARQAIEGGKVHYNGARTKPGKIPATGDEVTIRQGWDSKTVIITALSDQRRGATEAATLYQETEESIKQREEAAALRKNLRLSEAAPPGRPSKKQRRDIRQFHDRNQ